MQEIKRKIVLIGCKGVGKTSLIKKFVHNHFDEKYLSTIGVKVDKKEVVIGDNNISLILWDVAGELLNDRMLSSYTLGAHAIVYVHDLTRPESFNTCLSTLEKIKCDKKIIVGNKTDLITANNNNFSTKSDYTTSAKSGEGVEKLFLEIAESSIN